MPLIARFLLVFLVVVTTSDGHAAPPKPTFASAQDILRWINGYRSHPEPKRLTAAVRAMSQLGLFKDLDAGGVYVGFIAGVLSESPDDAPLYIEKMFPLPPDEQVVVIRAIVYSGLDNWKALLNQFAERMPARQGLIDRHLSDKLPTMTNLPLDQSPPALDTYWGFYFATGNLEAIDRIILALSWAKDGDNLDKLTLGNMAKWTLANNALQDKNLLDHLKGEKLRRTGKIRAELADIIEAAETFETSKIRKAAMTAIDDLKRKGPESSRQMSWWGTAGQTALALGCVAASALGHVEVGVPCVLGGAASSAALKFLTPQ